MPSKKILFVINTLGQGGAENALIELMRSLESLIDCEMHLYVMLGQGELVDRLPKSVKLLNKKYDSRDVLSKKGKQALYRHTLGMMFKRNAGIKNLSYMISNLKNMKSAGGVKPEKLLWKAVADSAPKINEKYDLAIAFIEGASSYFVANRVNADKKVAFFHVDYRHSGYSRKLDQSCYDYFDRIFCVSDDTRKSFLLEYPELDERTKVFRNIIDEDYIKMRAEQGKGFEDDYDGIRIVTLGRLVKQKSFEESIRAMKIIKEHGYNARWYIFGDGEERQYLETEIKKLALEDCFFLPGVTRNPYQFLKQTDIYVQCTLFEGQSIAVREAKIFGLPVILSDTNGNRDQVENEQDGLIVPFDSKEIAGAVERLINDEPLRRALGSAAAKSTQKFDDIKGLLEILE